MDMIFFPGQILRKEFFNLDTKVKLDNNYSADKLLLPAL
jgi:hypothetical protein